MGVGIEMIILAILLVGGGFFIYWIAFRGPSRIRFVDFTKPGMRPRRLAVLSALLFLLIVVALTFEFCSEQQHRMDKNTYKDNSLDNVGKGENEPGADDQSK
ncbi:hypothetical protein GCM10027347_17220 [Larkinella harenae]